MSYQHRCDGMLTIECQSPILQTLTKEQASELTAWVAKDLHAVLKIQGDTALVFCGAAFTTEQLLQPKFPVQLNIMQYATAAFQGELHHDQVLSIGSNAGQMPDGLQPVHAEHSLYHLPFCLLTNDAVLAQEFEASLMHKGMISPPTYESLQQVISQDSPVVVNHANYMSYLDLVAMMHNHYEQLGLSHVWQIIETALVNNEPKTAVTTDTGNHFYLVDHLLFTPFFSWSQYSQYFATDDITDYINWLMAQRLSMGAFVTHGLEIKAFKATSWPIDEAQVCLGKFEQQHIKQSFWTEQLDGQQATDQPIIYHHHPTAGVVAISAAAPYDKISVFYPVTPQGISDIEHSLRQQFGPEFAASKNDVAQNPNSLL